jgi:hypothetical protein
LEDNWHLEFIRSAVVTFYKNFIPDYTEDKSVPQNLEKLYVLENIMTNYANKMINLAVGKKRSSGSGGTKIK